MAANLYTQQSRNVFKTWLLMIAFVGLVSGLGYLFSEMFASPIILIVAVLFSLGMNLYAYWNSDKVAIKQARAIPADPVEFKGLHNMVENLSITAGLPKPKLFIINDS